MYYFLKDLRSKIYDLRVLNHTSKILILCIVDLTGLEPVTFALQMRCSSQLNYRPSSVRS